MRIGVWILSVVVAFLAGWGVGRGGSNDSPEKTSAPPRTAATKTVDERRESRSVWGQRLRDDSGTWAKVPREERGGAMEAWLQSYGFGGPAGGELSSIRRALDQWANEDFDGAWAWANRLHDAGARELAVTSLAGAIAASNPARALECFIAHGEFHRRIDDFRLTSLLEGQSNMAAAESPEALTRLWSKIPKAAHSVDTFYGITVTIPEHADPAAYLDAMREIRSGARNPVSLSGVMEAWAKRDPEAATDYLLARGGAHPIHEEWHDVRRVIKDAHGQPAADRWMVETLRATPADQRSVFFKNLNLEWSADQLLGVDPTLFNPGERAGFAAEILRLQADSDRDYQALLSKVPAAEWVPALENVRGLRATGALEAYLRSGGIAETEVLRISGRVRQPAE